MKYLFSFIVILPLISSVTLVDSLSTALKKAPTYKKQDIYFEPGTAYANEGQFKDAIKTFSELITLTFSKKIITIVSILLANRNNMLIMAS